MAMLAITVRARARLWRTLAIITEPAMRAITRPNQT